MNAHHHRVAVATILVGAILPTTFARAQLGDLLRQGQSAGSLGGGLGDWAARCPASP